MSGESPKKAVEELRKKVEELEKTKELEKAEEIQKAEELIKRNVFSESIINLFNNIKNSSIEIAGEKNNFLNKIQKLESELVNLFASSGSNERLLTNLEASLKRELERINNLIKLKINNKNKILKLNEESILKIFFEKFGISDEFDSPESNSSNQNIEDKNSNIDIMRTIESLKNDDRLKSKQKLLNGKLKSKYLNEEQRKNIEEDIEKLFKEYAILLLSNNEDSDLTINKLLEKLEELEELIKHKVEEAKKNKKEVEANAPIKAESFYDKLRVFRQMIKS